MININQIKTFFDEKAPTWDNKIDDTVQRTRRIVNLSKLENAFGGANVLDVGCGTGVMFTSMLNAGASHITGIDVSEKMVEAAQTKFAKNPNITVTCADVLDLKAAHQFDVVMMYNVYPHLRDKDQLANVVVNQLKTNGRFIVAHSAGKETINGHHKGHPLSISEPLHSAEEESQRWQKRFSIDVLIDTEDLYCFSGTLNNS